MIRETQLDAGKVQQVRVLIVSNQSEYAEAAERVAGQPKSLPLMIVSPEAWSQLQDLLDEAADGFFDSWGFGGFVEP